MTRPRLWILPVASVGPSYRANPLLGSCNRHACRFFPTKHFDGNGLFIAALSCIPIPKSTTLFALGFQHLTIRYHSYTHTIREMKSRDMHSLSIRSFALFTLFLSPATAEPPTNNINDAPSKQVTISTPTGPLTVLQSIRIPNFGIANVWPHDRYPTWLRPIEVASIDLLLDIVIARYATRPSDDIAGYGTVGPESSPALSKLETRVTVKQWVPTNWTRSPAAPMRNQDIAYAAQM